MQSSFTCFAEITSFMRQDDDNNKTKKPLIFCFHWEVVSSIADVCGIFDL